MEINLEQLKCGECGEKRHELYLRPNGEIIVECIKCDSKSIIKIHGEPEIQIRNHSGLGTICVY